MIFRRWAITGYDSQMDEVYTWKFWRLRNAKFHLHIAVLEAMKAEIGPGKHRPKIVHWKLWDRQTNTNIDTRGI